MLFRSKTLILIFLVTFLTFMVAFAAMVVVAKPEVLERLDLDLERFGLGREVSSAPAAAAPGATGERPAGSADRTAPTTSHVRGRVLDAAGYPLESAVVHVLEGQEDGTLELDDPVVLATATSDGRGEFGQPG